MANPRRKKATAPPVPTTPDPIEMAMVAERADGSADSPARTLLVNQNRLVRWQIASERAGLALKVLTMTVGVIAAGLLALMAWQASRADGLVVEPFSVPPEVAQDGATGVVIAQEVLNSLAQFSRPTPNTSQLRITDSWTTASQVQIPRTGVSFDELDRLLRRSLGRETHVTGSVLRTASGIVLSAQTSGQPMVRVAGSRDELPAMTATLAEQLMRQARPVQYAARMIQRQQLGEAERVLRATIGAPRSPRELAEAHYVLGTLFQLQARIPAAAAEFAIAEGQGIEVARLNLGYMMRALGREGEAVAWTNRALAWASRRRDVSESVRASELARAHGQRALLLGDFRQAEREFLPGRTSNLYGVFASGPGDLAQALIGLHQPGQARAAIPAAFGASTYAPRAEAYRSGLTVLAAAEAGDWSGLLAHLDIAAPPLPGVIAAPSADAWRALALARLGRVAEAQAVAARLPTDCLRCLRTRAAVAEAAGDSAGADRWLAEGVRRNRVSPFPETDWAQLELARGDADAAIAKAKAAHRKSPNFADPVETWGEALLAKGDAAGAAKKFAEAAKLAPRWGALHLNWGEALAKLGKADEARAKWRAAAAMDLTPADRAALRAKGV